MILLFNRSVPLAFGRTLVEIRLYFWVNLVKHSNNWADRTTVFDRVFILGLERGRGVISIRFCGRDPGLR